MCLPASQAQWLQLAKEFEAKWQFPHAVGAIGGNQIAVKAPPNSGSEFFNYKKHFSIVLLASWLILHVISHYGDRTIHTQKNMAEWKKSNIFINADLVSFNEAENRLLAQDLENKNVKDALKELKALVELVSRRHFGKDQTCHLYSVGQYFPMLQRMVCQWYKQFMRRMTIRCRVSSPWKVIMDISIPN